MTEDQCLFLRALIHSFFGATRPDESFTVQQLAAKLKRTCLAEDRRFFGNEAAEVAIGKQCAFLWKHGLLHRRDRTANTKRLYYKA